MFAVENEVNSMYLLREMQNNFCYIMVYGEKSKNFIDVTVIQTYFLKIFLIFIRHIEMDYNMIR